MAKILKVMGCVAVLLYLGGCTLSQTEKEIDRQIEQEAGVSSQRELAKRGHRLLLEDPSLSEEQRRKMRQLYARTFARSAQIRQKMGKTKSVFFKQLFKQVPNNDELRVLEKKLLRLNDEKMQLMLDSMQQARKILGKDFPVEKIPYDFERP